MPTLSPQASFNVQPESPVDKGPTMFEGIAGLIGTGLDVAAELRPEASNEEELLEAGLVQGLQEAQALRDAGKETEAQQMERRIRINYSVAGGDLNSGRTQELITSYTGAPADALGFTPDEMMMQELTDPSTDLGGRFQKAYMSTFANPEYESLGDEERFDIALSIMAQEEASEAMASEAEFAWTTGVRNSFVERINNTSAALVGSIHLMAKNNQQLSLSDVQAARANWQAYRTQITSQRPQNVPQEQWSEIEAQLDAVDSQIEYFETLAGPENLDALAASKLISGLNQLPISDPQKNILTRMLAADPKLLADINALQQTDVFKILKSMVDGGDGSVTVSPDSVDPGAVANPDGTPKDPVTIFQDARTNLDTGGLVQGEGIRQNSALRNEWGRTIQRGLDGLDAMSQNGDYLEGAEYSQMFNQRFWDNLNAVRDTDPTLYNTIVTKTSKVLTKQGMRLEAEINNRMQGTGLQFNPSTGEFRLDEQGIRNMLPAQFRQFGPILERTVQEDFGGDWMAALNSRGQQYDANSVERKAWDYIANQYDVKVGELKGLGQAVSDVMELQSQLETVEPSARPTRNTVSGAPQTKLHDLIDQTEGGGSYDTLYRHAQRPGGAFEGTKVSQMTLAELEQFANDVYRPHNRSQYGENASPMGRYQYVATTMLEVAREMGLSKDTVFSPSVQDAIFAYHVRDLIEGKNPERQRSILRNTWVGFRSASDEQLDAAIADFMGTPMPDPKATRRASQPGAAGARIRQAAGDVPLQMGTPTGEGSEAPQAPSTGVSEAPSVDGAQVAGSGEAEGGSIRPQPRPERTGSQQATQEWRQLVTERLKREGMDDELIAKVLAAMVEEGQEEGTDG